MASTVNVPFPVGILSPDGTMGNDIGVPALVQPVGKSVQQIGDINISGTITSSAQAGSAVQVGTLATADTNAENWIQQATASKEPLVIEGKASASGNLLAVKDSTGALLFHVGPLGFTYYSTNAASDETLLSRSTSVDMNTATATTLFTCPTGKSCIIKRIIISAASTSLTTASISFGWTSTAFNDVVADAQYTALTGATLYSVVAPKAGSKIGTSTGTFKVLCNTLQGAAATVTIDVFGIVY